MNHWERFYGGGKSLAERARMNVYKTLKTPVIISWLKEFKFKIYPDNDIGRVLFVSGVYEPNSLLVVKAFLPKDGVFFDVGANAGVFTIASSFWVGELGKVVAFEPSSRERKCLVENVALNRLRNVKVEQFAISNTNGFASLRIAIDQHNGQNTLCEEFAYEGVSSGIHEKVSVTTLDHYVSENDFSRIDVIKLDIEGAEYFAFQGAKTALEKFRPVLIFEIVESALKKNKLNINDIEIFLESLKYSFFQINESTAQLFAGSLKSSGDGNIVAIPNEKIPTYSNLGLIQD